MIATQASVYARRIRLRARREPYHAPTLWRLEVVNAVRSLERRRLKQIDAAASLERLRVPPGNRLELSKKDRAGQWSIRINDQWRISLDKHNRSV